MKVLVSHILQPATVTVFLSDTLITPLHVCIILLLVWLPVTLIAIGKSAISATARQHVHVGYKCASIGISVTTKLLHIDSTKLHQNAFEGKP